MVEIPQALTKNFKKGPLFSLSQLSTFLKKQQQQQKNPKKTCPEEWFFQICLYVPKLGLQFMRTIWIARWLSRPHDFGSSRLRKFIF